MMRCAHVATLVGMLVSMAATTAAQTTPPAAKAARRHAVGAPRSDACSSTTPLPPNRRSPTPMATPSRGSAFNVGRAYLNVTGQINHRIGFRVTPDIVRETGVGSSLERQPDLPPEVCVRPVQHGRLDDARLMGAPRACSRRRMSTSSKASTATGSRERSSKSATDSSPRLTPARRFITTSTAIMATSTAASTTARTTTAPR